VEDLWNENIISLKMTCLVIKVLINVWHDEREREYCFIINGKLKEKKKTMNKSWWGVFVAINEAGFAVRERNHVVSLSGACLDGVTHKGKGYIYKQIKERERESNLPIIIICTCREGVHE
jgi:hypothetical protein